MERIASTDADQFADRKIPRNTVHSLTQQTWDAHILHTSKDRISAIHLDDYYQTYRVLVAYLSYLDHLANGPTAEGLH